MSTDQIPFPTTGSSADGPAPTPSPMSGAASDAAPTSALSGGSSDHNSLSSGAGAGLSGGETRSRELLDKVVRTAHQSIDRLAESAAPRLGKLEQSLTGATGALQARGEHWRETGDVWTESLRTTVRDHPLAALAVAVAAGMLIARLSEK